MAKKVQAAIPLTWWQVVNNLPINDETKKEINRLVENAIEEAEQQAYYDGESSGMNQCYESHDSSYD